MVDRSSLLDVPTKPPKARAYFAMLLIQVASFFLVFSSFNAAQSLDGSIPAPPGLAATQFCALYVTFGALCVSAPKLISLTGPKWGMAIGMSAYVSLVASFLAPPYCDVNAPPHERCWSISTIWAVRLTTAVLVGFGASLVWTGQGVYLGRLAAHAAHSEVATAVEREPTPMDAAASLNASDAARRERLGSTLKRYNGLFWSCFQLSGTCGLVVSSLVLTLVQCVRYGGQAPPATHTPGRRRLLCTRAISYKKCGSERAPRAVLCVCLWCACV